MKNAINPARKDVLALLANSIVQKAIPEHRINDFADAISDAQHRIIGMDICTVGICLDYRWEGVLNDLKLEDFKDDRLGIIRSIEIFPEGIILPESARMRISRSF